MKNQGFSKFFFSKRGNDLEARLSRNRDGCIAIFRESPYIVIWRKCACPMRHPFSRAFLRGSKPGCGSSRGWGCRSKAIRPEPGLTYWGIARVGLDPRHPAVVTCGRLEFEPYIYLGMAVPQPERRSLRGEPTAKTSSKTATYCHLLPKCVG